MINVSFNDLAIGSDLPAQRTAPRPAEASTFAAMMDEADARRPGNADARDRSTEPRDSSVETRDATRAERPSAAVERPNDYDAKDAPAATPAKSNAPAPRDAADATAPRNHADATRSETTENTAEPSTQQTGDDTKTTAATDDAASQTRPDQKPADETATDDSQNTILVPAVALIQTPAQPVAVTPTFEAAGVALVGAPQTAAPTAPQLPIGDNVLPQAQPEQAATPAAPSVAPDLTKSGDAAQFADIINDAAAATTPAASVTMPAPTVTVDKSAASATTGSSAVSTTTTPAAAIVANAPAVPTGKGQATSATLFAATALSQPAAETSDKTPPTAAPQVATTTAKPEPAPQAATQVAPQTASLTTPADSTAATPAVAAPLPENAQPAEPLPRQTGAASQNVSAAPSPNTQPGANTTPSQMAGDLAAVLGGSPRIAVDVSQDAAPASLKPAPSLANGMIAQIGAAQSTETKTGTPTTMLGGADASATAQNTTPTQTAMAVAAAPVVQAVADETRPKLTATADGLVVNAPAPTAAPHTATSSAIDATAAGKPTVPTPPVFDQVAVHVAKAAADGLDKINIKLKPASLGQIEVQLEVASDGRVHAVIAADKPETLDLLQRDARSLERALGDAGLRADSGSLSFNLRGQGQQFGNGGNGFANYGGAERTQNNDIALPADNAARLGAYLNSRAAAGGVDIRV